MLVPEELSGMLHSATLSTQLHRKAQDRFRPVTETVCLANSCLKDGNRHRDSSRITGKIVHLSLSSPCGTLVEQAVQLARQHR